MTKVAEECFVDSNVLLAGCDESRDFHSRAVRLLEEGLSGKRSLFASGQVVREFLVVATRPVEANGLGMGPGDALSNVAEFSRCVRLLEEGDAVNQRLRELVRKHRLRGKRIHDANIVATMVAHGLTRLATANEADFKTFRDVIEVFD